MDPQFKPTTNMWLAQPAIAMCSRVEQLGDGAAEARGGHKEAMRLVGDVETGGAVGTEVGATGADGAEADSSQPPPQSSGFLAMTCNGAGSHLINSHS